MLFQCAGGIICGVVIFATIVAECNAKYGISEGRKDNSTICYECNSEYDPRCGDPFDPYTIGFVDCSKKSPLNHILEKPTFCRKTVQKIQGRVRIVRGCGYIREAREKECLLRSGTKDVQVRYCSCKSNLCNNSLYKNPSKIVLVLMMLLQLK